MKKKLAMFGGPKTIDSDFMKYNSIGLEEAEAVSKVVQTGVLSRFLGCWDPDFLGGQKVREFETAWSSYFGTKHAMTVNSNTSGLIAALGAIGIEPGDEVIVSPWTMSASATAILHWNAIPVFADIDPFTFNLDPESIGKRISPLTRAIMVTDIFGQAADLNEIMTIARNHHLKVIEDAAQAPGALYKGKYVGTVADAGVFSLNYHKHIHTGEGGVCVTDDDSIAERIRLIRNHAEAVVADKPVDDLSNLLGFNFRMTEVEAAIGIEQLKKLKFLTDVRSASAGRLSEGLKGLRGLTLPTVRTHNTHVYYVYPLLLDPDTLGVPRNRIVDALKAEGVPNLNSGYQLLHLLPLYQKRIAYGKKGFPWVPEIYKGSVSYEVGICPVAEKLHFSTFLETEFCVSTYDNSEVDKTIEAFHKVWDNLDELR